MGARTIHLWETYEIILYAEEKYENYYTDVCVWADLKGPDFEKRCFGFWDGENVFKIRVTATEPGLWTYTTGANVEDKGLTGISGAFAGISWTEEEKEKIVTRRGIIRASENGHALVYADGTPYVMVGDTWWGLASYRYPWEETEAEQPIGKSMSMKDMARQRLRQGFNTVGMIAAFPTWADDGEEAWIMLDDGHETTVRNAWTVDGSSRAGARSGIAACKDMHNEGGRPFFFPGRVKGYESLVPDYDRLNPEYFKMLDKKINWLNEQGITVFIETMRRDCSKTWKYYYDWPMVYVRYIQYVFARYQTNNCIFSPIHFDIKMNTIDSREFNEPINLMTDIYGKPPFGTLLGTNPSPSTLINYGGSDEQHWLSLHQIGNWREHENYWYLTDIYHASPACPAINGEPYYSGYPESAMKIDENGNTVTELGTLTADSEEDHLNCRSGYYGSVLSGAYGGVLAGFEGGWGANIEEGNTYNIWDTMRFPVSYQVRYVRDFLLSEGKRYMDLIPNADLVTPNKMGEPYGYRGWAFASATSRRDLILGYTEKGCPRAAIRGLRPYEKYIFSWFNPSYGTWTENREIEVNAVGMLPLPEYPEDRDWAFKLKRKEGPYKIDTSENPKTSLEEYKKQKGERNRKMQKILNDPDNIVDEMLEGFVNVHKDIVEKTENPRVLKAKHIPQNKVGIITGGGSGHKPAFIGYVGANMCDAAAVGEIFSSPTPGAFLDAMKAVDQGRGVACLYGNYSGDNMNVKIAVRMAEKQGINVKTIVANDDAASAPIEEKEKRRGVAGEILMWKAAGAMAAKGADLDTVINTAQKAIDHTRSVGVGVKPCTLPATGRQGFEIAEGTMELGIGHHGEPGVAVLPLETADKLAERLLNIIVQDVPLSSGDETVVLLSGLGATPVMELYVLYNEVEKLLRKKRIRIHRALVGNYFTSLDMGGATLTVMKLDEELKELIDYPVNTAGWK